MGATAIEKIRLAEARAESIEAEAREKAEGIIAKAQADAETIVKKAKADGEAEYKAAVEASEDTTRLNSSENRKKAEADLAKLNAAAEEKLSLAADIVKKKLIS